jgi:hypothetical protein
MAMPNDSITDTSYLDKLLEVLRKHDVALYKDGDFVLQLAPKPIAFDDAEISDVVAGQWKRGKDLEE